MILEGLAGIFVSVVVIISFHYLGFSKSVNHWISVISKFVYVIGHPLMDDDQIQSEITKRYGNVFMSLVIVILKIITLFLIIFISVALTSVVISFFRSEDLSGINMNNIWSFLLPDYLLNYPFIIGSLIPAIAIYFIPKKKAEANSYSHMDKFLHYVFMGNRNVAILLLKLELWLNRKELKNKKSNKNVYISGMARAGTTALMQVLGQIDQFESLSYRNLPFVFLPRTWPKFVKEKKVKEIERYHQDGVKHGLNSYEALEEPFWRNILGRRYIKEDKIVRHNLQKEEFDKYNSFRRLVAGEKIYLAKNNNHLFRAESIHLFDNKLGNSTNTIIPFRNPYDQAHSLLRQHRLLSSLQQEDDFTLDYMDFLVHHEFGMNHKIPDLKNSMDKSIIIGQINSVEYWLEIWFLFYNEVYSKFHDLDNIYFFCYEDFIGNPKGSIENILSVVDIEKKALDSIQIKKFTPPKNNYSRNNYMKYIDLYNKLKGLAIN